MTDCLTKCILATEILIIKEVMEYISVSDAAKEKKVTRTAIYIAIGDGRLDPTKIAGRIVILLNKKYNSYKKQTKRG